MRALRRVFNVKNAPPARRKRSTLSPRGELVPCASAQEHVRLSHSRSGGPQQPSRSKGRGGSFLRQGSKRLNPKAEVCPHISRYGPLGRHAWRLEIRKNTAKTL
jgi:hypothetical protein